MTDTAKGATTTGDQRPAVDVPALSVTQMLALFIGEQAIEDLPWRERDDLISKGLAIRAWPNTTNAGWRTWLTEAGVRVRLALCDPYTGPRYAALPDRSAHQQPNTPP
jgi:hypothetical protein